MVQTWFPRIFNGTNIKFDIVTAMYASSVYIDYQSLYVGRFSDRFYFFGSCIYLSLNMGNNHFALFKMSDKVLWLSPFSFCMRTRYFFLFIIGVVRMWESADGVECCFFCFLFFQRPHLQLEHRHTDYIVSATYIYTISVSRLYLPRSRGITSWRYLNDRKRYSVIIRFEIKVVHLLDWLSIKVKDSSLSCYFT